jgi:hypothetical protein
VRFSKRLFLTLYKIIPYIKNLRVLRGFPFGCGSVALCPWRLRGENDFTAVMQDSGRQWTALKGIIFASFSLNLTKKLPQAVRRGMIPV